MLKRLLGSANVPVLTAPVESGMGNGVAGELVETVPGIKESGVRHSRIEGCDGAGRAVHDGRAAVDDLHRI